MAQRDTARRDELRAALNDPWRLCERLRLTERAVRQSSGLSVLCPNHNESEPSCSVTAGPDGGIRVKCHACGFTGDAFTLVAKVNGLELPRDFAKVLDLAEEVAGFSPMAPRFSPPAPPLRSMPPAVDVEAAWSSLPALDAEGWEYLKSRGLDEAADLCRSVPQSGGPPNLSGMRFAVAMRDAAGKVVAIQARDLGPAGQHKFRVLGSSKAGVFGDPRRLAEPGVKWVIAVEGLTDFLAASIAIGPTNAKALVVGVAGVENGAAFKALPFGDKRVVLASDADDKGDAFATDCMLEFTRRKVASVRARPVGKKDLCEMRAAGVDLRAWLVEIAKETGFRNFGQRIEGERAARLADAGKELTFGVKFLDRALDGIVPRDVVLVGAESGFGKTDLLTICAMNNALGGKRVHYFALEPQPLEIERRIKFKMLARRVREDPRTYGKTIDFSAWHSGRLDDVTGPHEEEVDAILREQLSTLHTFYRNERGGEFTPADFDRMARNITDETDLICLDHVHYFDHGDDENRGQKKTSIAIRDLVLQTGRPVVMAAHLRKRNSGSKKNATLIPERDDFEGSSHLFKPVKKAILVAPAFIDRPNAWTFPTFIAPVKNTLDGSRCRYVGLVNFSIRSNTYGEKFTLVRMVKNGTAFEDVKPHDLPDWAEE